MATATRPRRPRRAATPAPADLHNVQLASGRGPVHAQHPATGGAPYPACRTVDPHATPERVAARTGRYAHALGDVTCEKCLGQAKASPRAARARRNGPAQAEAQQQAEKIIAEETAKVRAQAKLRGEAVGEDWSADRKSGVSDEDYALAQQVRELRAQGLAWWAIGHKLELKGHGPSAKAGKTGAAAARRLWERAWGKTYTDTSVPRETKAVKAERAMTQPGTPYFPHDEDDAVIMNRVKGADIEWVARVGNGTDTAVCAVLKAEVSATAPMSVVQGPKGRVLRFYEVVRDDKGIPLTGPQRSVYIDRIEKVGAL